MIIIVFRLLRALLFGLFLAGAGGFMTWWSVQQNYAGVVILVHVIFALLGILLIFLAIRTADRALRTLLR